MDVCWAAAFTWRPALPAATPIAIVPDAVLMNFCARYPYRVVLDLDRSSEIWETFIEDIVILLKLWAVLWKKTALTTNANPAMIYF